MVWVCLMGLIMPQTVLCQAELTELWSLVCKKNVIVPVSDFVLFFGRGACVFVVSHGLGLICRLSAVFRLSPDEVDESLAGCMG